jgi:5'(3')-deoxyribonucleotidase
MKKTIAVDLDDVLANTTDHLREYYNHRFGTDIKLEDHKTYMLNDLWNCSMQKTIDIIYDFLESDYGKSIIPFAGSQYAIDILDKKYDLIILTSRPLDFSDLTASWVNKYFPNKFKEIVITNKMAKNKLPSREKCDICVEKKIDIMIEDNLHYAMQNANYNVMTYLMDRPWNQAEKLPTLIKRVYAWNEILNDL